MANLIIGKNACREALRSGRKLEKILLLKGLGEKDQPAISEIRSSAEAKKVPVEYAPKKTLDRMADGGVHQGVIALAGEFQYSSLKDMIGFAREREEKLLLLVLDGLEDPHNLGAILRTAECAGVHGVIIPKNRSVGVTETVMKTSAGAAEYVRCAQVTNIPRTIDALKKEGVWVYGCHMGGDRLWDTDLTGDAALVIGNEGKGISRLVREKCDFMISVPQFGRIDSLNASNAAAVMIYEAVRQRENQREKR